MKKFVIMLVAILGTMFTEANAMSYEQAREQALFLTDKMAYELNLNEAQYEAAYEINLDYLLGVNTVDDVYADYWVRRNTDFRYILMDWQYDAFIAANYFYRPIWWEAGYWHFGIYARYPHRTYLYFGRPHFFVTYTGGHAWHRNGGRSWYHGRTYVTHNHGNFSGMRDGWNRGDYRSGTRRETQRSGNFSGSRGSNFSGSRSSNSRENARGNSSDGVYNRGSRDSRGGSFSNENRNSSGVNRSSVEGGSRNGNFNGSRGGSDGMRQSSTRTTVNRPTESRSTTTTSTTTSRRSTFTPSRSASVSSHGSSFGGGASMSRGGGASMSRGGGASMSHGGGSHGGGSHGGGHGGGNFGGRR